MPTYSFRNNETKEEFDKFFKSSSLKDEFLEQNPQLQQIHTSTVGLIDPTRLGIRKPDDAFRDRLRDIKQSHLHSTINTF